MSEAQCAGAKPLEPAAQAIPVFLINLDRAVDRLAGMRAQFDALGISHERVAAVDGRLLCQRTLDGGCATGLRSRLKPRLSPAEIGCFLSHASIWKRMLVEGHRYACVMEDDVNLAPDVAVWLRRPELIPDDTDILKLEGIRKHKVRRGTVVAECGRWRLVQCWSSASGAACYIISQKAARRLLEREMPIAVPVDTALYRYWEHGLRILDVLPYPARQAGLASQIQPDCAPARRCFRELRQKWRASLHPLDWKPVVYSRACAVRWRDLGVRSLEFQPIGTFDSSFA